MLKDNSSLIQKPFSIATAIPAASPPILRGVYVAKVKNFLVVKVDYIDKIVGEDFEKVLLSSTFN